MTGQLLGVLAAVAVWLIGHLPGWAWVVLGFVAVTNMIRRTPLLAGLGLVLGFRGARGAVRASHASPARLLVVVIVGAAALGHALGMGDGGQAPADPAAAVSTAGAAGADLVVEVGYNAGWRGPDLASAGAFAWIESGDRPAAVSRTGCLGLWQLCPTHTRDLDPQTNANDAHAKWAACAGGSFGCDWTPYDGGSSNPGWAAGYAAAQHAMAALPNGGN